MLKASMQVALPTIMYLIREVTDVAVRRRFFWSVGSPAHRACKPSAWEMEFRFVPDEIARRFAFGSHVAPEIDPRIFGRNSRASDPGMTVRIQGRTGRMVPVQREGRVFLPPPSSLHRAGGPPPAADRSRSSPKRSLEPPSFVPAGCICDCCFRQFRIRNDDDIVLEGSNGRAAPGDVADIALFARIQLDVIANPYLACQGNIEPAE